MKNKNSCTARIGIKIIIPCLLAFFAIALTGCSVSPRPKDATKTLVPPNAPVFDKRFKDVTFQDLNLDNFWTERKDHETREAIPITNNTYADITDRVKEGVVNIYTLRLEERDVKIGISPNDILPFRIPVVSAILEIIPFKVPISFNTQGLSLGSGFIINDQGFILTNAHVVQNAVDIQVLLSEGKKSYPAKIIGMDLLTDTALLKIEADQPLTALPLGDSDRLRMGEMALAVGNPLGLRHTVTSGLISAKERGSIQPNDKYAYFIQTDSAINPGSSGGPLINLYGEVIGINTAIVSDAQLIGFAIPVNTVKEVMNFLVLGLTERGWFGAQAAPLGIEQAVDLNYTGKGGMLVQEVEENSPAEKSGLKVNDIIVKINGQPIASFLIFRRKLLGLSPGQQIHVTIVRDGREKEISSTLVQRKLDEEPSLPAEE